MKNVLKIAGALTGIGVAVACGISLIKGNDNDDVLLLDEFDEIDDPDADAKQEETAAD